MSVSPSEETLTPAVIYRFDAFSLDPDERQLLRDGERVDLTARYFDALVLLVREHGRLVEKDRFFEEVWGDVVVSDSALTQAIKEIRKQLGDDASAPRYVETVPRYGYRFIGAVEDARAERPNPSPAPAASPALAEAVGEAERRRVPIGDALRWAGAGAMGGALAGVFGGLLYGSALAYAPGDSGLGTASVLLVLLALNVLVGVLGGAGVSAGIAAVRWTARRPAGWSLWGAALGGLLVGGVANLLGGDAFRLVLGRAPSGITGAPEGAALGLALALGARMGAGAAARSSGATRQWWPAAGAGVAGAAMGAAIPAVGGHLMGGSLRLLSQSFAGSRLHLDAIGRVFGESDFGLTSQMVLGGAEGLLFGVCVVGALVWTSRWTATGEHGANG